MSEAKRYVTECYGGGEGLGAPALAVFDIDRETAEFIIRMARLVKVQKIYKIERFDCRAWFFESDPREDLEDSQRNAVEVDPWLLDWEDDENVMRTEADRLSVTDDDFRFLTYRKHCDDEIETEGQGVAELAAHFDIPWDFGGPVKYLIAKHGSEGEDPKFPRSEWSKVANSEHPHDYFEWLLSRYEAEGINLPAGAIGPTEKVTAYVERLVQKGVSAADLDEIVHDLKSSEASGLNNGGLSAQVQYLVEAGGSGDIESLIA